MIFKLSVIVLLCSIIILVKSESYIEVDEYGNEYEVKKFNIQGRQLNDAPQCVVTRRRRGIDTSRQYNVEPVYEDEQLPQDGEDTAEDVEDNEEEDENQHVIKVENTDALNNGMKSNKTEPGILIDDMKDNDDIKPTDNKKQMEKPSQNDAELTLILPQNTLENKEKEEKVETIVAVHKVPKKNKLQKVTLIRPQASEETLNSAAELPQQSFQVIPSSLLSNTADNEFMIINAQKPQTGVVSSLSSLLGGMPAAQDYESGAEILPFSWTYSNQPISTSAIWSTGENIDNNAFNKIYNSHQADKFPDDLSSSDVIDPDLSTYPQSDELRPSRPVGNRPPKKNSRPNKNNRRKVVVRRPVQNARPMRNGRPGRPARRPQSAIRRPNKKRNPAANTSTRRPSNIIQSNKRNKNKTNNKRKSNKPAQSIASFSQHNNNSKNKRKKNKKGTQPAVITSTFTRSVTSSDKDSKIDCIIINKDREVPAPSTTTTTTTPRPFWNVFGRRATNTAQSRDFGNRKRVNLRFTA